MKSASQQAGQKFDFDPKIKNDVITGGDVINYTAVLDTICEVVAHYKILFLMGFRQLE